MSEDIHIRYAEALRARDALEAENVTLKQERDEACELYAREAHKRIVQEEAASVEIAALKQERDAFKQDAIDRAADCFEAGVKLEAAEAERDRALQDAKDFDSLTVLHDQAIAERDRLRQALTKIANTAEIGLNIGPVIRIAKASLSPSETEEGG